MSTRFDGREALLLGQILDDSDLSPTPALLLDDKSLSPWLQYKIKELCSHDISGDPALAFRKNVASIEQGMGADDMVVAWVNVKEASIVLRTGWHILLQVLYFHQGNNGEGMLEKVIKHQIDALAKFQRKWGTREIMSKGDADFMKELFGEGNKAWMARVLRQCA